MHTNSSGKELYARITDNLLKFECADLLGANDVLQIWRHVNKPFDSIEDLLESVEHVIAYVRAENVKVEAHKKLGKGWIMKTLANGYFGEPEGFVSWRTRQREEKLQRAQRRSEEALADFDADFTLWEAELRPDDRKTLLKDLLKTTFQFASPTMARKVLREHYARQEGRFEYCSEDMGRDSSVPAGSAV